MPLPCKKAEVLQYNNYKCAECQTQFSGKTELVTHFQQIRAAPNSVSFDDEDRMSLVLSVMACRRLLKAQTFLRCKLQVSNCFYFKKDFVPLSLAVLFDFPFLPDMHSMFPTHDAA